jgi:hypothetical protein
LDEFQLLGVSTEWPMNYRFLQVADFGVGQLKEIPKKHIDRPKGLSMHKNHRH